MSLIMMLRPTLAVGAVGLAVTATLVAPTLFRKPAPVAFAQVEQAMDKVQTVSYRITHYALRDGVEKSRFTNEIWHRLNPGASVSRYVPSPNEAQFYGIEDLSLYTPEQSITYNKRVNRVTITRFNADRFRNTDFDGAWFKPFFIAPKVKERQASTDVHFFKINYTPWQQREVEYEGQSLLLFEREEMPTQPNSDRMRIYPARLRIWVDPTTNRFVRTERRQQYDYWNFWTKPGRWERETNISLTENYCYNEEPPSGTFDFQPPANAQVVYRDGRKQNVPLTPELRRKLQTFFDTMDTLYVKGDRTRLLSLLDLTYLPNEPDTRSTYESLTWRRNRWADWPGGEKGQWRSWKSKIHNVTAVREVWYLQKSVPQNEPDLLQVNVTTEKVDWRGKKYTAYRHLYLRRVGSSYKVLRWP